MLYRRIAMFSAALLVPTAGFAQQQCSVQNSDGGAELVSEAPQEPRLPSLAAPIIAVQPAFRASQIDTPATSKGRDDLAVTTPPMPVADSATGRAARPWGRAVQHVAAAGAAVSEISALHGMRTVVARTSAQFMVLNETPDGAAAVAGLMSGITVAQLLDAAQGRVNDLGTYHGLRTLLIRSGDHFQTFYGTPDGEAVIPGVMYDGDGKNLTRDQIAAVPGTTPTVLAGDVAGRPSGGKATLAVAQSAISGTVGPDGAPRLWMFIDPQCSYSVRAMQQLQPMVASGRVQLSIIPVSVLDREDNGLSTRNTLAMLSLPDSRMVTAWSTGRLGAAETTPEAAARLRTNMDVAQALQLKGTPTFVWTKADGSAGRVDGIPKDMQALIASLRS